MLVGAAVEAVVGAPIPPTRVVLVREDRYKKREEMDLFVMAVLPLLVGRRRMKKPTGRRGRDGA